MGVAGQVFDGVAFSLVGEGGDGCGDGGGVEGVEESCFEAEAGEEVFVAVDAP